MVLGPKGINVKLPDGKVKYGSDSNIIFHIIKYLFLNFLKNTL